MAINLNSPSMYVKGAVEMVAYDIETNDMIGYTDKLTDASFSSGGNDGLISGGPGNVPLMYLPDSATFTGTMTAQDFSMDARQFQTGGSLAYNAIGRIKENITATGTTLTVTGDPVANYGETPDADGNVSVYIRGSATAYKVNPTTKQIVDFVATAGQTYCVSYYQRNASAQVLAIPTVFSPKVCRVVLKLSVFSAQGNANGMNSSKVANLFIIVPRAQFVGGDAGINGSQTENATTSWQFTALAYNPSGDLECRECAVDESILAYYVLVPCDTSTSAVQSLVVVGEPVTVAEGASVQLPVFYVMPDNSLVTPRYADLTFTSAAPATATVSATGLLSGVAEGSTTVTVFITDRPTVTTVASVTVTG